MGIQRQKGKGKTVMKLSVPSSVRGRGAPVMKNISVFPVLSSENSCCACTQQRYYTSICADVKRFFAHFRKFFTGTQTRTEFCPFFPLFSRTGTVLHTFHPKPPQNTQGNQKKCKNFKKTLDLSSPLWYSRCTCPGSFFMFKITDPVQGG